MKRTLTIATAVLMLAASGVYAQQAPAEQPRYRTESPWSPLTYEYLGATPKVDLAKRFAPKATKAEARATATDRASDVVTRSMPAAQASVGQGKSVTAAPATH